MPTIEVDRNHISTLAENPDGEIELRPVEGGLVAMTLTKQGTRVTLYLGPNEADGVGLSFIKCALAAASSHAAPPKPGSPILKVAR